MPDFREALNKPSGKAIAAIIIVVGVGLMAWSLYAQFGPSEADRAMREAPWMCAKTGKPFTYRIKDGDTVPVKSPHSGENTGYPAERCFWTKDGQAKTAFTPVLLEQTLGKPGPTFCPDCDRLVTPHNPAPRTGGSPPPTRAEYESRRKSSDRD